MVGCGIILAGIIGIVIGAIAGALFGSMGMGIVVGIVAFLVVYGYFAQGLAIGNMATQDKRDKEILDELKKMNNKDE